MRETKVCVFCEARPTTIEDIWPKWIGRYLGRRPARTFIRDTSGLIRSFRGLSNVQRAKVVCETCNGGWMKGLEDYANPLLKVMFDERLAIALHGSDTTQLKVAQWIVKTAMMLQLAYTLETTSAIPDLVFKEFARSQIIPDDCFIFLARHSQQRIPNGMQNMGWRLESNSRSGVDFSGQMFGTTFFIKNVVVQVVGYSLDTSGTKLDLRFPQRFAPYVQRLWPMSRPIEWPPTGPSLDDRQLIAFAEAMADILPS